jgi:hypothetical protein
MELIAVFHCYVSKGIEILTNNCLQEKIIKVHCYIISLDFYIFFTSQHIASDADCHLTSEFYNNRSCVVYGKELHSIITK